MKKQLFINLPIKNLEKSVEFFKKLGFNFNPMFSDEKASCMIIEENIFCMLIKESYFKNFTKKEIIDSSKYVEVLLSISAKSIEEVDEMVKKAIEAGGKYSSDKIEMDMMYGWSFQDIDGHNWEIIYMDPNFVPEKE